MKPFLHGSRMHMTGFLLVLLICISCKKDAVPIDPSQSNAALSKAGVANLALPITGESQTKTATRFNDYPNRTVVDNFSKEGAQYVAFDDNSYAYTTKLNPRKGAMIVLQGFDFTIPPDARIDNIFVSVIRFKKGGALLKDQFSTLLKTPNVQGSLFQPYGVNWTEPQYYPDTEAEFIYSQSGTGNNAGFDGTQFYQWTPSMINNRDFGIRIETARPATSSATLYYELVQITVEFTIL